jgi:hypothetical protein
MKALSSCTDATTGKLVYFNPDAVLTVKPVGSQVEIRFFTDVKEDSIMSSDTLNAVVANINLNV